MHHLWTFLTSATAPWWSTLLGVILGGLLTYLTSRANDKRRMEYEDKRRWHRDFVSASSVIMAVGLKVADAVVYEWPEERIRELHDEFTAAAATIQLTAPAKVGIAVRAMAMELLKLQRVSDREQRRPHAEAFVDAYTEFREAMREVIGVED